MPLANVLLKLNGAYDEIGVASPFVKVDGHYQDWSQSSPFVKVDGSYDLVGHTLPENTAPPSIAGTDLEPGNTLTVTPGTWTGNPAPALTYQWKRAGVAISGATALTYIIQDADRTKAITCVETGTNTQGGVEATSNSITIPVGLSNITPPSIAGAGSTPGTTLTVTPGTWTGNPAPTLTYQWELGGTPIAGQTGLTYVIQDADRGLPITCVESAVNPQGQGSATSNSITPAAAPANTVPVTIIGAGGNLPGTALTVVPGTWTGYPVPNLTYQWERDDSPIDGANGLSYIVQDVDRGYEMTCDETAMNIEGSSTVTSNIITIPIAPANTLEPTIDCVGVEEPGNTITVTPGVWVGYPLPVLTHQWQRAGVAISGETGLTYVIQEADRELEISCQETGTNSQGQGTATSNAILITPNQEAPGNTTAPTIAGGNLNPGNTLTVTPGTWTGTPVPVLTYHWERGGEVIAGATGLTYLIQEEDRNHDITCVETATNAAGSETATSNQIKIPIAPANTVTPTITGSNLVAGSVLTVTPGTWTGYPVPVLTHQWKRNGVAISGETGLTYTLVAADEGTNTSCTETATNSAGSLAATSNPLAIPAVKPANTVVPVITGDNTIGSVLTSTTGTWTGTPTITYGYQWKRDGTNIAGETSSTHTLVEADGGKSITSQVTATNAGGSTAATSNAIVVELPWTPANLFQNGEDGFWYDSSDLSTMFQDYTYTIPVTESGQPVGGWKNKIVGRPTDFNLTSDISNERPILEIDSGKSKVVFDGAYAKLKWAAYIADPYAVTAMSFGVGINGEGGTAYPFVFYWDNTALAIRPNLDFGVYILGGGDSSSNAPNPYPAQNVVLFSGDQSTPITAWVNGVETVTSYTAYSNITNISGASIPQTQGIKIRISQFVFINRLLTPEERDQLEAFIASKQ